MSITKRMVIEYDDEKGWTAKLSHISGAFISPPDMLFAHRILDTEFRNFTLTQRAEKAAQPNPIAQIKGDN